MKYLIKIYDEDSQIVAEYEFAGTEGQAYLDGWATSDTWTFYTYIDVTEIKE